MGDTSGRVLVAGAGVAGLAAAAALRRVGVDVTLVEPRPELQPTGFALNLPANAVRALGALGVAEAVCAAGVPVSRREYRSARGRLLFAVDETAFWSGIAPSVAVPRGFLLDALTAGQHVRRGIGVATIDTGRDAAADRPRVTFTDGSEGTFDLVVGADGIGSTVRDTITTVRPRSSAMTAAAWRFVTANPGIDAWTTWTGHGRVLLLMPVSATEVYGYAASNAGGPVGTELMWLTESFTRFPTVARRAIRTALRAPTPPQRSPVDEVRADRWHLGRVAVIGDAAHATGPVWAQGAAMGLEDAVVLAEEVARHGVGPAAPAAWERRRRHRVEHVQAATDRMSRLARVPDRIANLAIPLAGSRGFRAAYGPLRPLP